MPSMKLSPTVLFIVTAHLSLGVRGPAVNPGFTTHAGDWVFLSLGILRRKMGSSLPLWLGGGGGLANEMIQSEPLAPMDPHQLSVFISTLSAAVQ